MIRRWGIWVALTFTLFACWWVGRAEQSVDTVKMSQSSQVPRRVTLAQALPKIVVEHQVPFQPMAIVEETPIVNLFSSVEMPAGEIAEAPVSVPVSPYTYAGRLQEDGRWTVFLTDGQQQYVLREGDRFAEGWKVTVLDQQRVVLQHAAERFEIRLDNGVVF